MFRIATRKSLIAPALGLAFVAGCGDVPSTTDADPSVPTVETSASAPQDQPPAPSVTPVPGIDPDAQSEVVRQETVEGGEATEGPSPLDVLYQEPRQQPEPDEELVVDVPLGLEPITLGYNVPAYNPITKAKWELGRQLYFDPRLSKNGTVSCATCHNPEKGWTDQSPVSTGIHGQKGDRSAPTVINTVYGKTMFWDGRAPSLEGQAQGPPQNPIEMGDQSFAEIVGRLREIPGYQEQFLKVFGTDVTLDGMAKAIATFERTVLAGNSPYDRYQSGEFDAMDESAKRGMVLFGLRPDFEDEHDYDAAGVVLKKANCTSCHIGANFSNELFHNLGVGFDPSDGTLADEGRWAITPIGAKSPADRGTFKTPTLRQLLHTAPYMHDGSEATLEAVVDYYNKGGNPNPNLDPEMKPLNLTDQEKADVVAFMKALTGDMPQVELPTLPPGPDGSAPDPRAALEPPTSDTANAVSPHGILVR